MVIHDSRAEIPFPFRDMDFGPESIHSMTSSLKRISARNTSAAEIPAIQKRFMWGFTSMSDGFET
jgi:hypothetical protein